MAKVKELKPEAKEKFKVHALAGQTVLTSELPPSIRSGIDRRITRAPVAQSFQGMGYDAEVIEENINKGETPELSARNRLLDGLKASEGFVKYMKVFPSRGESRARRAKPAVKIAKSKVGTKKLDIDVGVEQRQYGSRRGRVLDVGSLIYKVELYTRMGWRTYKFKQSGSERGIAPGDAVECRIYSIDGQLSPRLFKIVMPAVDKQALEEKFIERGKKSLEALEARLREEGGA